VSLPSHFAPSISTWWQCWPRSGPKQPLTTPSLGKDGPSNALVLQLRPGNPNSSQLIYRSQWAITEV
jgi:hypothetical protein